MTLRDKLNNAQIVLLRYLVKRGTGVTPIAIQSWMRKHALVLCRRDLVSIWYQQCPGLQPSLRGPYCGLTVAGARLAYEFLPAPRGPSGAEPKT